MLNPHARLPLSPLAMLRSLWANRVLIGRLARRDIVARYRGSFGGLLWAVVTPLVMLVVYTFVFSVIFNARWGTGAEQDKAQFAVVLFAGLLVHGLLSEVLNAAPGMVGAHANYVKKVVFPLEVLPIIQWCVSMFQCLIGVVVLLAAGWVLNGTLPATAPLIVLVLLPLSLITLGLAWFLASLGVYVRDVGQVTQVFTSILLFVSPVFFPVSAIPEEFREPIRFNPLTFLIEQAREVLVWGRWPDVAGLLAYTAGALVVAWLGYAWFQATRKGFADVL
ncbi:MAG: ABC transporter permease [Pseudomonadota bacterium]|nr:ABC transporter permease [Pseudomonadota bacterium]